MWHPLIGSISNLPRPSILVRKSHLPFLASFDSTTSLLTYAGIKTDSSIPADRCHHLPAESHCWLQHPSIYGGWSGWKWRRRRRRTEREREKKRRRAATWASLLGLWCLQVQLGAREYFNLLRGIWENKPCSSAWWHAALLDAINTVWAKFVLQRHLASCWLMMANTQEGKKQNKKQRKNRQKVEKLNM